MRKNEIIALNKCDLDGWEDILDYLTELLGCKIYPISAATGFGLKDLAIALGKAAGVLPKAWDE